MKTGKTKMNGKHESETASNRKTRDRKKEMRTNSKENKEEKDIETRKKKVKVIQKDSDEVRYMRLG